MGILSNERVQYFIHEATSNLSAAIRTRNKAGTSVTDDSEFVYMNFNSSITAASSANKWKPSLFINNNTIPEINV